MVRSELPGAHNAELCVAIAVIYDEMAIGISDPQMTVYSNDLNDLSNRKIS